MYLPMYTYTILTNTPGIFCIFNAKPIITH